MLAPHLLFRMLNVDGVCSDNLEIQLSKTTDGENPGEIGKSLAVCALCKYLLVRHSAKADVSQRCSLHRSKMYYRARNLFFA